MDQCTPDRPIYQNIYEQKRALISTPLESSTFYTVDDMIYTLNNKKTTYTSKSLSFL